MPTGNLPASGKALWERVYDEAKKGSCKDSGDRKDECAARVAWTAVKNAGWKKDEEGNWHKSSFTEFSLRIDRASYDKATNERRWRAVASDTDEDSRQDSMSLELFNDFIERIQTGEPVPEDFRSDFWAGGMPYLSVSHYPDLNGEGIPGVVDAVYIDGSYLKAKGKFHDNPLGRKCFESICADLYGEKSESNDKVRISIAFLDWAHKHKSNGVIFEREDEEDICPECLKEIIKGNGKGKVFLSGHLVHLAMTRVPVNKRTDMEVDKSMADIKTRKDDAASIVGDELADELEQKATLVGKSEVLVIKSDEETPQVEEAKTKDSKKKMEDEEEPCDPEVDEGCGKKKDEKKSETEPQMGALLSQEMFDSLITSMKSAISEEIRIVVRPPDPTPHPLDKAFATFKAAFDGLSSISGEAEKLHAIQEPFNLFGQVIVDTVKSTVKPPDFTPTPAPDGSDLAATLSKAITDAMTPIAQKLDMVSAQLQSSVTDRVPQRRSIPPSLVQEQTRTVVESPTPHLRAIIEKTT
jgi:cation transport regulator ChaB